MQNAREEKRGILYVCVIFIFVKMHEKKFKLSAEFG